VGAGLAGRDVAMEPERELSLLPGPAKDAVASDLDLLASRVGDDAEARKPAIPGDARAGCVRFERIDGRLGDLHPPLLTAGSRKLMKSDASSGIFSHHIARK